MEIFSEAVRKLWNDWQLRGLVLLSLTLQIILIILGNRRKYSASAWVSGVLWVTYLSADRVATVALGVLSSNLRDPNKSTGAAITAFWAPFLLVHLGGPDTITAYSVEDNELWKRHFLELLVQVGVAVYVFIKSWTSGTSYLLVLSVPVFVAGIIKYGERTWALLSSSYGNFKDYNFDRRPTRTAPESDIGSQMEKLYDKTMPCVAFDLFLKFNCLYSEVLCSVQDMKFSVGLFTHHISSAEEAFGVVALELGFMFDALFTKASVIWSSSSSVAGCILRISSFTCSVSALVGFTLTHKQGCPTADVLTSYALLVGAVTLEIYAMVLWSSSDWAVVWLTDHPERSSTSLLSPIYRALTTFILAVNTCCGWRSEKRWSRKVRQLNLISLGLRSRRATSSLRKFCCLPPLSSWEHTSLLLLWFLEWQEGHQQVHVSELTMQLIFDHVKDIHDGGTANETHMAVQHPETLVEKLIHGRHRREELEYSDFRAMILILHFVTDLCNPYSKKESWEEDRDASTSRVLSNYMLYLLAVRPSMLPKGIGKFWHPRISQRTADLVNRYCAAGPNNNFWDESKARIDFQSGCHQESDDSWLDVKGSKLAQELGITLETAEKWKRIRGAWVEMLCFAAKKCEWRSGHAPQLARGGDLLTHVSLLMSHYGLTDQTRNARSGDGGHTVYTRLDAR